MVGDDKQPGPRALAGAVVLVAEDEALIAMDLEMILQELGCAVLGPAASAADALLLLARRRPDAALLDLVLTDGPAAPVAEALAAAGVPFALLTGTAGTPDHPALRGAPRLDKPFAPGQLRRLLVLLLGPAAGTPPTAA